MIAVIRIKLLLFLLIAIAITFLIVQNQQPVALVFFGGVFSITLPIAFWVLLFTASGIITTIFCRTLNALFKPSSSKPSVPKSPPSRSQSAPVSQPRQDKQKLSASPPSLREDWGQKTEIDEWDIEEPPIDPTEIFNRGRTERVRVQDKTSPLETPQEPTSVSRQGTVYSYSYREQRDRIEPQEKIDPEGKTPVTDTNPSKPESVYDANYRIITPPYRDSTEEKPSRDEEEEDWV